MLDRFRPLLSHEPGYIDPSLHIFPKYRQRFVFATELFMRVRASELTSKLTTGEFSRYKKTWKSYECDDSFITKIYQEYDEKHRADLHYAIKILDYSNLCWCHDVFVTELDQHSGYYLNQHNAQRLVMSKDTYELLVQGRSSEEVRNDVNHILSNQLVMKVENRYYR